MRGWWRIGSGAAFLGLTVMSLSHLEQLTVAQDKTPPEKTAAPEKSAPGKAETTEAAKSDSPAAGEYAKLFAEWTALVKDQRKLQQDYRLEADAKKRDDIRKAFGEKSTAASAKLPALADAAAAALAADPKNVELADFVAMMGLYENQSSDNFERIGKFCDLVVSSGSLKDKRSTLGDGERRAIYAVGAIAALEQVATQSDKAPQQFDKAQKYLDELAQRSQDGTRQANYIKQRLDKDKELWKKETEIRTAEEKAAADPATALPRVKLVIKGKGEIVLELFENEAPNTVANFISLTKSGFYNGKTFHRVIGKFVAQGGCSKGDGTGGPPGDYRIACECFEKKKVGDKEEPIFRHHFRGSISMAHSGRDTGGSQFFICLSGDESTRNLDASFDVDGKPNKGHTVFGRVVSGFDVLAKIQRRDPDKKENHIVPDAIESATVLRSRKPNHEYTVKKVGDDTKKDTAKKADEKKTDDKKSDEKKSDEKGKS